VNDYSTPPIPQAPQSAPPAPCGAITFSSRVKTLIVTFLSWLLAWRPSLAMLLGCLVLRVWPAFRKA
jgi:hypothetical protein